MKIGIISDLHANPYALEVALQHFRTVSVHKLVCAGDLTGYSPLVNETFDILKKLDIDVIIGNHDHYVLSGCPDDKNAVVRECIHKTRQIIHKENLDFLQSLATNKMVQAGGVRIRLVHGSPFDPLEEYIYPDKDIVVSDYRLCGEDLLVLGHTHHQMVKGTDDFTILNPGSTGQPRDAYGHVCFALYDTANRAAELVRLKYDTSGMIQTLVQAKWPEVLLKYFR